jgi:hypothetical protein
VESFGSRDIVEVPELISKEVFQQIQRLYNEFNNNNNNNSPVDDYESLFRQVQTIISREGNLHVHSLHSGPLLRSSLPKLGLREGWREALLSLSLRGVPTFIFSSGYGDIVNNVLLSEGITASSTIGAGAGSESFSSSSSSVGNTLPQNIRIVSNFFRVAPDGTVRAFSQPIVHEKNKNISTIERFLGMSVPRRSYAIVLGSEEDEVVKMTEGLEGLKEQLSIGFLELNEDFQQRLPVREKKALSLLFVFPFIALLVCSSSSSPPLNLIFLQLFPFSWFSVFF